MQGWHDRKIMLSSTDNPEIYFFHELYHEIS